MPDTASRLAALGLADRAEVSRIAIGR